MKDTKGIGERTEGIVLAHLLKMGKTVLLPFGNNQPYDLVIDDDGSFIRVQCKTARFRNGCIEFDANRRCTINGKRRSYYGLADIILAYSLYTDKIYCIPVEKNMPKAITLRVHPPRGGAISHIRFASDYEY